MISLIFFCFLQDLFFDIETCFTSHRGGNLVEGLPLASNTVARRIYSFDFLMYFEKNMLISFFHSAPEFVYLMFFQLHNDASLETLKILDENRFPLNVDAFKKCGHQVPPRRP